MKDKRLMRLLSLVVAMYLNSICYAVFSAYFNARYDIWALSHYVILGVFFLVYAELKNKKSSIMYYSIFFAAFVMIMTGYVISRQVLWSLAFWLLSGGQMILEVYIILVCRKHSQYGVVNKKKKEESKVSDSSQLVAHFMLDAASRDEGRTIIKSAGAMSVCCLIAIAIIVLSSIARHYEDIHTFLYAFMMLLTTFVVVDIYKNSKFYSIRKAKHRGIAVVEYALAVLGFSVYFWINAVVYNGSSTYLFILYLIPSCALIPFFITSMRISRDYIMFTKQLKKGEQDYE